MKVEDIRCVVEEVTYQAVANDSCDGCVGYDTNLCNLLGKCAEGGHYKGSPYLIWKEIPDDIDSLKEVNITSTTPFAITPVKYKIRQNIKPFQYYLEQHMNSEEELVWFITLPSDKFFDFHYATFRNYKNGFSTIEEACEELHKYLKN